MYQNFSDLKKAQVTKQDFAQVFDVQFNCSFSGPSLKGFSCPECCLFLFIWI